MNNLNYEWVKNTTQLAGFMKNYKENTNLEYSLEVDIEYS